MSPVPLRLTQTISPRPPTGRQWLQLSLFSFPTVTISRVLLFLSLSLALSIFRLLHYYSASPYGLLGTPRTARGSCRRWWGGLGITMRSGHPAREAAGCRLKAGQYPGQWNKDSHSLWLRALNSMLRPYVRGPCACYCSIRIETQPSVSPPHPIHTPPPNRKGW